MHVGCILCLFTLDYTIYVYIYAYIIGIQYTCIHIQICRCMYIYYIIYIISYIYIYTCHIHTLYHYISLEQKSANRHQSSTQLLWLTTSGRSAMRRAACRSCRPRGHEARASRPSRHAERTWESSWKADLPSN